MHLLQVDMQIVTKNDYGCAKIMIPDAKGRVTILKSQSNPLNFVIQVQIYKILSDDKLGFFFRFEDIIWAFWRYNVHMNVSCGWPTLCMW